MHYRQHAANVVGIRYSATALRSLLRRGLLAWFRDAARQWRAYVLLRESLGRLGLGAHIPPAGRIGDLGAGGRFWRDGSLLRNIFTLRVGAIVAFMLPDEDA